MLMITRLILQSSIKLGLAFKKQWRYRDYGTQILCLPIERNIARLGILIGQYCTKFKQDTASTVRAPCHDVKNLQPCLSTFPASNYSPRSKGAPCPCSDQAKVSTIPLWRRAGTTCAVVEDNVLSASSEVSRCTAAPAP